MFTKKRYLRFGGNQTPKQPNHFNCLCTATRLRTVRRCHRLLFFFFFFSSPSSRRRHLACSPLQFEHWRFALVFVFVHKLVFGHSLLVQWMLKSFRLHFSIVSHYCQLCWAIRTARPVQLQSLTIFGVWKRVSSRWFTIGTAFCWHSIVDKLHEIVVSVSHSFVRSLYFLFWDNLFSFFCFVFVTFPVFHGTALDDRHKFLSQSTAIEQRRTDENRK